MNPIKDQIISVIFPGGIQVDGKVVSWTDEKAIILSLSGASTFIINSPLKNVLFIKISNAKENYATITTSAVRPENIKEVAELKIELNKLEKEEIREKLNSHIPGEPRQISYDIPNITIKHSQQYSREEIPRQSSQFNQSLSNLFKKEH